MADHRHKYNGLIECLNDGVFRSKELGNHMISNIGRHDIAGVIINGDLTREFNYQVQHSLCCLRQFSEDYVRLPKFKTLPWFQINWTLSLSNIFIID